MPEITQEMIDSFAGSFKFQLGDVVRLKTDDRCRRRFTIIGRQWRQNTGGVQKLYRVAFAAASGAVAVQDVAECALGYAETLRSEKII